LTVLPVDAGFSYAASQGLAGYFYSCVLIPGFDSMALNSLSPERSGFKFRNIFYLPLPGRGQPALIGLCGGMCFAALDAWESDRQPQPELTKGLLRYLILRQWSSLTTARLLALFMSLLMPDVVLKAFTMRFSIPKLRRCLANGRPQVLLLFRTRGFRQILNNHQVLAIEYQQRSADLAKIGIYDPNYGQQTAAMAISSDPEHVFIHHSTGEVDRGFLVLDNGFNSLFAWLYRIVIK
jgi:hypothetical protein